MTALLTGALGFVAKLHPPATEPEEDGDEEYIPDLRAYRQTHLDIVEEQDEYDEGDTIVHERVAPEDFINQQSWRLLMRSYVVVAETCSPPGSFRKVQASTGWHPREQKIFRQMLVDAGLAVVDGAGTLAWTSTKGQRRTWLANVTFPPTPPPLQKAPCPTENPSPEVLEHPVPDLEHLENSGTPENTENL